MSLQDLKGTYMLDLAGFIPAYTLFTLPSPPYPAGLSFPIGKRCDQGGLPGIGGTYL
jgi:hypothetical protein